MFVVRQPPSQSRNKIFPSSPKDPSLLSLLSRPTPGPDKHHPTSACSSTFSRTRQKWNWTACSLCILLLLLHITPLRCCCSISSCFLNAVGKYPTVPMVQLDAPLAGAWACSDFLVLVSVSMVTVCIHTSLRGCFNFYWINVLRWKRCHTVGVCLIF